MVQTMPVIEVADIPLVAGSNVFDRGSEAARIWQNMIDIISQQEGTESIYFGLQHENPNVAQLFIVWTGLEFHKRFQGRDIYQHMLKSLEPIMDGPPQLLHFKLGSRDHLASALMAPVTELATLYLPTETSSFHSDLGAFAKILIGYSEGFSYSFSIEDVEHKSLGAGVKGKACQLAIGWSSISAHLAFKHTDAFRKGLEYLKDARGSEIHHTTFRAAT
ncbi:hypothetical protein E4T39_04483 [Aureobasidium subglaciale]|nr:hypothetical protein E4T39_04483 [Aureobasidium subglaciale]